MEKIFVTIFLILVLLFNFYNQTYPHPQKAEFIVRRSAHFIFNYTPGIKESWIDRLKSQAENFYRIITGEFYLVRDTPWMWENRAKIFVAKDKDDFVRRFPCPVWSGACVDYRKKIIYTYIDQTFLTSILAHELTHIIFREYVGQTIELPLWLDEGVALYVECKYTDSPYRMSEDLVKEMIKKDSYIEWEKMNKITKNYLEKSEQDFVRQFYLQAWSMVNFLRKRFGKIKFKELIDYIKKGNTAEKALFSVYGLIDDWSDFDRLWKRFYLR